MEAIMEPAEPPTRKLFVDGSSREAGSGTGIVLESPKGHKLNCAVRFGFKASNNAAEYEARPVSLRLAREMQVRRLVASSDSQLIVNQVSGSFTTKDSSMVAYLKLVKDLIPQFERFKLIQVPRLENTHADALSKFASSKDFELLKVVPIEHLLKHSIFGGEEERGKEVEKKGCALRPERGCALQKRLRLTTSPMQPSQNLSVVTSPWPFAKWGINFIGPLPKGRESATFAIVAINYFTKWVKAEPLAKITKANTIKFIWKNIICRFGILHSLVSDNGRLFDNRKMRELCDEMGIKKDFSMPHHPQANGQVEAVNKTIKHTLKRKLDTSKGAWVDELPHVLWATSETATGETPF
ncbi:uncharacterized protein LOC111398180 [Olea europaea var. sylvestris]|uniref:uncharacterized protein LOC111398180 n=1 Tax=Olea europaea var. sylvestris TaxID=158386 RepID=UPI000C1CD632|nr:uncharacterized protein LOC111398180 [Olea europaea var. sylvestris]